MTNQSAILSALGDPTRRSIFEQVAHRPSSVAELARVAPVSRPAVSQHLRVLKDAGIVRDHAEGTRRIYSVDPVGLAAVREYFEQFWRASLASFGEAATRSRQEEP
jgi:DNA-binding transcriptional ArsR family regulator